MEERRVRRFWRERRQASPQNTILPIRTIPTTTQSHNHEQDLPSNNSTLSCCYCDYKITAFNHSIFLLGRRHARFLTLWFSIGIGFSLTALLGVTLILLWHLFNPNLSTALFLGFAPPVSGISISLADIAYVCISTFISVSAHEFGHALSAASEGVQMEYIAIFFAVLFPGALVAFNYDLLQALPHFAALRVYCSGIWHNAVCSAVCGSVLFFLPLILFPFYIHGERPMVLDISSSSPLSGYLSPGDVILSMDGIRIHNTKEWLEVTSLIDELTSQKSNHSQFFKGLQMVDGRRGYCVPSSMMEESKKMELVDNQFVCPNDLHTFVAIPCSAWSRLDGGSSADGHLNGRESSHCLTPKDIVKLKKCGDGWVTAITNGSTCLCSQDDSCLAPVQLPGLKWVEITYSRSHSPECLQLSRNSFPGSETFDFKDNDCGGVFVFVGDVISMAHSVQLTTYQPRWAFVFGAYLPTVLEKILMWTFHVSLLLALLNSLPVYFLDGEAILEGTLFYLAMLSPRRRKKVLQACLCIGTIISTLSFLRIFINIL